jgi:putative heme-binding domain-containing protein
MRRWMGRASTVSITLGWLLAASIAQADLEDVAKNKPATASSFQTDDKYPGAAFDGEPESRWCAADGSAPQWLQVDLGQAESLTGCKILWEHADAPYLYKIEGSADGKTWTLLTDQTKNDSKAQERAHKFDAQGIRHVKLTVTEVDPSHWASLFSFEIFGNRQAPVVAKGQARKTSDRGILRGIKAPPGFELSVFAAPPDVRYPTCLAASPSGEVYVGIDENGSLDAKANRGRVVRCVDTDHDGKADKFNVFATMDSPRGVIWDDGTLYVLHPPTLTAFTDTDHDGVADKSEVLIKGIGFDLKFRGADHTTNGIRLGIDGYIYVAVGDYGFIKAEGKDGATHQLLGGGIARVRTDGTGFEIVSRGQRNIYDVAIDPYMNLFTRDNTNDGDGWDVRLSHVVPTGHYGYPSLFKRFADEHIQPLADYGGGSPCGSLFIDEPILPRPYNGMLYTCEWGRGGIFMHPLTANGAGFKAEQQMFLEIPRPTDMDVDGVGRIYVSSWRDGGFNYSKPEIGYVISLAPKGVEAAKFPDLKAASDQQLVAFIASDSAVRRLASQRELLKRGLKPQTVESLETLASNGKNLAGKVAAIFTLEQGLGAGSYPFLTRLAKTSPEVREFAIKALADRRENAAKVDDKVIAGYLIDPNPRVRFQAVVALGRLGHVDEGPEILPLTADSDPIVAHVAVKALVALNASNDCIKALEDSKLAPGASMALQAMHDPKTVAGLIRSLTDSKSVASRKPALKALVRLYFTEAPYEGKWWGTRPDTTGPYYNAVTWEGSEPIAAALQQAVKRSDDGSLRWLLGEMLKNKVDFEDTTALALKLSSTDPALKVAATDLLIGRPKLSTDAIKFLENLAMTDPDPTLKAKAIRGLLRHTNQQEARESSLRALALISEQDDPPVDLAGTWLDYTKDARHARDSGTYVKLAEGPDAGRGTLGYGVLIQIEGNPRAPETSRADAKRAIARAWEKPETSARVLRAVALSRSNAYAPQVKAALVDQRSEVKLAAEYAARKLGISSGTEARPRTRKERPIAALPYEEVVASALKDPGDPALGAVLFEKQGCINCHSVAKGQPIKGPYLGDVTTRYKRDELSEAILKPSAKIAQGFETVKVALSSGQTFEGFVVREAGDELEMRNSSGAVSIILKKDIEERAKGELSVMPQGLLDTLTPHDLASILAYLESLKGK